MIQFLHGGVGYGVGKSHCAFYSGNKIKKSSSIFLSILLSFILFIGFFSYNLAEALTSSVTVSNASTGSSVIVKITVTLQTDKGDRIAPPAKDNAVIKVNLYEYDPWPFSDDLITDTPISIPMKISGGGGGIAGATGSATASTSFTVPAGKVNDLLGEWHEGEELEIYAQVKDESVSTIPFGAGGLSGSVSDYKEFDLTKQAASIPQDSKQTVLAMTNPTLAIRMDNTLSPLFSKSSAAVTKSSSGLLVVQLANMPAMYPSGQNPFVKLQARVTDLNTKSSAILGNFFTIAGKTTDEKIPFTTDFAVPQNLPIDKIDKIEILGVTNTGETKVIMEGSIQPFYQEAPVAEIPKERGAAVVPGPPIHVPAWFKSNAQWWSQGIVSDTELLNSVENLMDEGILRIGQLKPVAATAQPKTQENIPAFVKNVFEWWADDLVSDTEVANSISYLIDQNIIRSQKITEKKTLLEQISGAPLQPEILEKVYVTMAWNKVAMDQLLRIKDYESKIVSESLKNIWGVYSNTDNQAVRDKAVFLQQLSPVLKEQAKKSVDISKKTSSLVDSLRQQAKAAGITPESLELKAAATQSAGSQIKTIKTSEQYEEAVKNFNRAEKEASAGLRDVLGDLGFDESKVPSYKQIAATLKSYDPKFLPSKKVITPELGGAIASDDGKLMMRFVPGAVAQNTIVSIEKISQEKWTKEIKSIQSLDAFYRISPDQIKLQKKAILNWFLAKDDRIAIDLPDNKQVDTTDADLVVDTDTSVDTDVSTDRGNYMCPPGEHKFKNFRDGQWYCYRCEISGQDVTLDFYGDGCTVGDTEGIGDVLDDLVHDVNGPDEIVEATPKTGGGLTVSAGVLEVQKGVVNDDGGTKTEDDFTFSLSLTDEKGNPVDSLDPQNKQGYQTDREGWQFTFHNPRGYTVNEVPDPQYNTYYIGDCSGAITTGETKYCYIINDDKPQLGGIIYDIFEDGPFVTIPGEDGVIVISPDIIDLDLDLRGMLFDLLPFGPGGGFGDIEIEGLDYPDFILDWYCPTTIDEPKTCPQEPVHDGSFSVRVSDGWVTFVPEDIDLPSIRHIDLEESSTIEIRQGLDLPPSYYHPADDADYEDEDEIHMDILLNRIGLMPNVPVYFEEGTIPSIVITGEELVIPILPIDGYKMSPELIELDIDPLVSTGQLELEGFVVGPFDGPETPTQPIPNPILTEAEIYFDKTGYVSGENLLFQIVTNDDNINTDKIDSIKATIKSTSDPVGLTVTLIETSYNTGIFSATVSLTNQASSGTKLKVSPGDTVTVTYLDQTTPSGAPANMVGTVKISVTPPPPPSPVSLGVTPSPSSASFTHGIGSTSCPQSIGTISFNSNMAGTLTLITVPGWLSVSISGNTAGLSFNCNIVSPTTQTLSGTATFQYTATDGQTKLISIPVTGQVNAAQQALQTVTFPPVQFTHLIFTTACPQWVSESSSQDAQGNPIPYTLVSKPSWLDVSVGNKATIFFNCNIATETTQTLTGEVKLSSIIQGQTQYTIIPVVGNIIAP